jgi:hypothetical protein
MYSLRIISPNGTQTNEYLGESYSKYVENGKKVIETSNHKFILNPENKNFIVTKEGTTYEKL